ncbi:hypothetical protein COO60DRAFT_1458135 [Scenedesmus sp. NREL 46B-D3]|nr:hypothetical protein COO60DRAFT_1458135 [Scenedesmus sp. NREL 46B-D3]
MFVHMEQPAAVRSADWAAASFGVNDLLLPALCASPITADQSPSCPSSNESSDSDVLMGGYSASMLDMEHQLQLLLEPGNGSLALSAGYQAPTPQTVPLYSTSQFVAAPGISPFSHSGGVDMLHQHRQHQYHASTVTQHQAAHAGNAPAPSKRRGRPPLSPGKYSRGYLAIKAYRQRKKGMVEGMEAEIAAMQEQVVLLQAEQAALQLKHHVLQAAATASDEVLSHMAALQLNPPAGAASAGTSSSTTSDGLEHLAQGLLPAHAQQQRSCSSPATNSSSSGFPAFPLGIADLLQLAQLQRSLQEPTAAAASSGRACMLDLGAGVLVEVGRDFWAKVAQQVPAPSSQQQQQRLEATWEVYSAALGGLAQDRQQLLGQLSAGAAGVDAASPAGIEGSLQLAAAVEQFASRARALTLTYEWALQGLLTDEQAAKMCVASWPYLPAVGAIVSSMLGRERAV